MIGTMSIMDRSGHSTITWDTESRASVRAAEREFNTLRSKGKLLYRAEPGSDDGELLRRFDPQAEHIVVTPNNNGG